MKNLFYFLSLLLCIGTTSCSNDDDSTSEPTKSDAKAITSFKFNATDNDELDVNITAVINENDKTITAAVPYGTDITSLIPTIEVSPKAAFSPEGAQDFSSEITYTVTAEDGTKAQYKVTVNVAPNTEAKIISFAFLAENNPALEEDATAIIDEEAKTVTAYVAYGTDMTGLTPTLEISQEASFTPEGAQDFSSEVVYTVTADDESTKVDYSVNVIESSNSDARILSFAFLAENNTALEENITATIDEDTKTIAAEVPYGTNVSGLIPVINVSPKATFTPEAPQDFSSEVTYTVTAQDGTKADYTVTVTVKPNNEAQVLSFAFLAENNPALEVDVTATINEDTKTITAVVPYGTDITELTPTLEVSPEASFTPEGAQDLSSEVTYTVTAEDGTKTDYIVIVTVIPNNEAKILSFVFIAGNNPALDEDITATIDQDTKTITAEVPYGTDVSLLPTIEASNGATITPEGAQDFSSEAIYTVAAEDGTQVDYTVHVNVEPNTEAKILSFAFLAENNIALEQDVTATINEDTKTITAEVPYGTDVTGLTPTLEVSPDATFIPEGAQDFSSEVVYTVTAQNESTTGYTVTLQIGMNPQRDVLIAIYNANPGNTLGWDLDDPGIGNWQGVTTDESGNVTELDLSSKKLTFLPVEIGQLVNLEVLDLEWNQITAIPAGIGQLSNLTRLILSNNRVTSLPAEIWDLSNLTELNLHSNQLTSIPAEIGQLSNLTHLFVINNDLTSVPAEIGQLANLEVLSLSQNQIASVPVEITQLANLETLSFEYNQLTSIPAEIGQLANLNRLGLSGNQLTSLPVEIGQLSNLESLYLYDNQLTSVPAEIGQLSNLNYLVLTSNQLTSIPQEVCDMETLYGTQISISDGVTCE